MSNNSIHAGERTTLTAEFITRRTTETDEGTVHRLLMKQNGTNIPILVAPEAGQLPGLKTGDTYRFESVLGMTTPSTGSRYSTDCPNCGHIIQTDPLYELSPDGVFEAAANMGIEGQFGIIDNDVEISTPGSFTDAEIHRVYNALKCEDVDSVVELMATRALPAPDEEANHE
jgi:hypothetical protein